MGIWRRIRALNALAELNGAARERVVVCASIGVEHVAVVVEPVVGGWCRVG